MTGGGGWPMSVFLTPDGRPFYGGTYFPDEPRHGMPSFRQVLEGVDRGLARAAGRGRGRRRAGSSQGLVEQAPARRPAATTRSTGPARGRVDAAIEASFDCAQRRLGRRAQVPAADDDRVPAPPARRDRRSRGRCAIARRTLDAMADGGIRDQLGGGFHRYSTDAHWLVPHFEQMLYDNAQLARVYLHAWALHRRRRGYREVATGDARLHAPRADDATTARSPRARTPTPTAIEGLTFTWRAPEIREVLGRRRPTSSRRPTASPTTATGRA